ncbi:hypothetical protein MMPV_010093 [Pyropia vietnamensis]
MADPPAGPRRAADGDFRGPPLATADARAAAAAAELRRVRRRPADAPTLATVYVAGVSRDVRQHRMRALLADVTGVDVHSIVDVDRFGATTAVTVVAAAAEGFRSAVGKGRAATVLRLLPTADPWAPALLGAARRRGLSAAAAAAAAAGFCRRRLEAKLAQLPARAAMPPHLRAALHAHIQGMLSSHAGGGPAPASPSGSAAHRSPPPPASEAARMPPAERATGAAATMPSAPTPTGGAPAPGPTTAAPDGPASPARGDAMADATGAAVARPFAPGRGADRLGRRSAAAKAAVPAQAASPSAASPPHRRSWVRRRPPAAASLARGVEAAARLPPLPPPPSPPPPGAARAAAFAASVALPLVAAARKRAAAARSRSPAPRARTTRRQVRLALAVARLGAAPASPARLAGRRTRGAAAAARVAAASPPPTPRAPKRARLRPPPTSPPPALGAATPAEARRPAPPPPSAAIPGHDEPGMAAHASAEARAEAVLNGEFSTALADRNAGVWRPSWRRCLDGRRRETRPAALAAKGMAPSQRRALRLVRAGRLSAAARTLLADEPAPHTAAVWRKATSLFPPATSASASAASVEAEFADLLADAAEFGDGATVPRGGDAGGEHLWALEAGGQDALVGVLELLVSAAAVTRVPAAAAHALAGADLLLLAKPGGVGGDGLPGLRPIGMPETLRKLAASALAATVRKAAAAFLAPAQLGVGVPSACERLVHELDAHLAHHPQHAVVQLDYRNAFNLVSRPAAAAVLRRALPPLAPYLEWVYGGGRAPTVYGWAAGGEGADGDAAPGGGAGDANGGDDGEGADGGDDDGVDGENGGGGGDGGDDDGGDDGGGGRDAATGGAVAPPPPPSSPPPPPPTRLALRAERGAQQGDPLGPLLHAAALWLVLRRLQDRHPGVLVRAFHDDVVAAGTPGELAAVMADAAAAGASVDAELAPTKCTGWSPAGAPAPAGWGGKWAAEGVVQFSVPLGGHAFVAAGVDRLVADQRRLVAAIAALPPEELQSQLLLLRLCAGPRANYWLRCLPLEAAARLAAAVDADAKAALGGMLCDARDSTATRAAVLERAALPPAMGGLGVGGRTRVVPAALLASWVDALRAGQAYSPALRATADGLLAVPRVAADGGPLPPVAVAPAAPPPDCGPWLSHEGRQGASAPPAVRSARSAGAPPRSGGPPPPSTPDRRAPAAAALRQALLSLLAAHAAHCAAPPSGLLWSMARGGPNSAADEAADALAPPPPPSPCPTPSTAPVRPPAPWPTGHTARRRTRHPRGSLSWGGEAPAAQRDLSRPAHAAARARIYAELSGWRRAGMAACQGGGAARWLSALPTSGTAGTAIPGAGMRVAVRLWLGAPPRSVPPAPRCRCGRDADADGRHFLSACPEQSSGHVRLHHHIVHLVVEALRRTPSWGAVEAEAVVERGRGALRPDLRATHASSGAVVWADASVTAPFGPRTTAPTAASPLRAVAAEAREREKVAKYANALPGPPASHTFTPLVWEAYGRIGPATAKWLRGAMRGPALSGVRSTLLTPEAAGGLRGPACVPPPPVGGALELLWLVGVLFVPVAAERVSVAAFKVELT